METPPQMSPPPSVAPDRTWDAPCHISAWPVSWFRSANPRTAILWLIKRQELPSVDAHGKEALNFQISVTIYMAVAAVLMLVIIGFFLMIGIAVAAIVSVVIAAVKASNGELYRYPLTIRLVN